VTLFKLVTEYFTGDTVCITLNCGALGVQYRCSN